MAIIKAQLDDEEIIVSLERNAIDVVVTPQIFNAAIGNSSVFPIV